MGNKKEFKLDDNDFNRISEISANKKPVVQIVNGLAVRMMEPERAQLFWESICVKYGFNPLTVETNLLMKDARYFLAEPVSLSADRLVNWCKLCNSFSGPDDSAGCDRYNEYGCGWYIKEKV